MKNAKQINPLYWAIVLYLIIFVLAAITVAGKEIWQFLTKTF